MDFDSMHNTYVKRCESALNIAVERFFQKNSVVSQAAEYALMSGGKRVRGVLVLAVSDMLCGDETHANVFAAAIEMIHAFSLIHDDMPCMDDDDMRRGKPSTHRAFGEANALLAGDLLSLMPFEIMAQDELDAKKAVLACRVLASAAGAKGMIYGQELDIKHELSCATNDDIIATHRHKTGALISAAAKLGTIAAGESPHKIAAIEKYSENIGLVFQIVDDILDETANEEELGKPLGSDKASGKSTFLTMWGVEKARAEAQRLTDEAVDCLNKHFPDSCSFLCEYAYKLLVRVK